MSFKEPIRATISDKFTRINAMIAVSASREYQHTQRKPLTEGKVGGLIQIQDFEIVATHLGPRTDRLTLLVKEFKSLGSDGSTGFGVPRPIESIDGEKYGLLEKLRKLRTQEKVTSTQGPSARESSAAASSMQSQFRTKPLSNSVPQESQAGFATQVPNVRDLQKSRPLDQATNGSSNEGSKKSTKSPGLPANLAEGMTPPISSKGQAATGKSNPKSAPADLLRLLEEKYQPKKNISTEPIKSVMERLKQTGQPTDATTAKPFVEAQPAQASHKVIESLIDPPLIEARSSVSFIEEATAVESSEIPSLTTDTKGSEMHVNDTRLPAASSPQRSSKKRKLSDRISSRDIGISRDQNNLLSRPDSWLPAEPGEQAPVANIPIAILQALNQDADRRAKDSVKPKSRYSGGASATQVEVLHDTQESEAESALPSEQWPLSPNRNQLPPDSSLPASDQSDGENEASESHKSRTLVAPLSSLQSNLIADDVSIDATKHDQSGSEHEAALGGTAAGAPSRLANAIVSTQKNSLQDGHSLQDVIAAGELDLSSDKQLMPQNTQTNESRINNEEHNSAIPQSSASAPDSDIEMTVPVALQETTESQINIALREMPLSAASQTKQPFTPSQAYPVCERPFSRCAETAFRKSRETFL